jgi:ribonuclease VapC
MIVDSSALVAIFLGEPETLALAKTLNSAESLSMSAGTFIELSIVIDRRKNPALSNLIEEIIEQFGIHIEPVTPEQARIARQAYRDFGRGSGHRANLNFGDCLAYALARVKREPLLYKGDEFLHTDLLSAMKPTP